MNVAAVDITIGDETLKLSSSDSGYHLETVISREDEQLIDDMFSGTPINPSMGGISGDWQKILAALSLTISKQLRKANQ